MSYERVERKVPFVCRSHSRTDSSRPQTQNIPNELQAINPDVRARLAIASSDSGANNNEIVVRACHCIPVGLLRKIHLAEQGLEAQVGMKAIKLMSPNIHHVSIVSFVAPF